MLPNEALKACLELAEGRHFTNTRNRETPVASG